MKREALETRNPFGVADVPDPNGEDVVAFAATVQLAGSADDANAIAWASAPATEMASLEGAWSSRWNGGADPTIVGDTPTRWKPGRATLAIHHTRIYILFDWNDGARQGLIEARREGVGRVIGRYVNLSDPSIARPWTGLLIDDSRIDGQWAQGRLDFRR